MRRSKKDLTPNQRRVLQAIHSSRLEHGIGPSTTEMVDITGMRAGAIVAAVNSLEARGLVKLNRDFHQSYRTLQLTESGHSAVGYVTDRDLLRRLLYAFEHGSSEKGYARLLVTMETARERLADEERIVQ